MPCTENGFLLPSSLPFAAEDHSGEARREDFFNGLLAER
jgi:hypothetical protein